jgi:hypothetical protein
MVKTVFGDKFYQILKNTKSFFGKYGRNREACVIYYLLDILNIDTEHKLILDIGAYSLVKGSNSLPLIIKRNMNGLLVEFNNDFYQEILLQRKELNIDSCCEIIHAEIYWDGKKCERTLKKNNFYPPLTTIDQLIKNYDVDYTNIICVDLDIDCGELFVWEDSDFLSESRPPVVMTEFKYGFRNNDIAEKKSSRATGFSNFHNAVYMSDGLGYIPVVTSANNLFCIAEEYKDDLEIPIVNHVSELLDEFYYQSKIEKTKDFLKQKI